MHFRNNRKHQLIMREFWQLYRFGSALLAHSDPDARPSNRGVDWAERKTIVTGLLFVPIRDKALFLASGNKSIFYACCTFGVIGNTTA